MNWRVESSVLDEGDSAGLLQDSFENHFRDMFLNVIHITYYMHTRGGQAYFEGAGATPCPPL